MRKILRQISFLTFCFYITFSYAKDATFASPHTSFDPNPRLFSSLALPEELGAITEQNFGDGSRTVILIQDAHGIPDAQKNIQEIIQYFQNLGINLIGLEGASSKLDPQIFRSFPEKSALKKVAQLYLERGELTGTTASAILNPKEGHYEGLEDWSLYEKGLGLYLAAAQQIKKLEKKINILKEDLEKRKKVAYSKELLEIDMLWNDFENGKIDFDKLLFACSKQKPPPPNLQIILRNLLNDEKNSQPSLLRELTKNIRKELSGDQDGLQELSSKEQSYRVSEISLEAYCDYLQHLIKTKNLKTRLPSDLKNKGLEHQKIQNLEGAIVFEELKIYVKAVKKKLLTKSKWLSLDQENERMRLLEKLSLLELSQNDYLQLKSQRFSENELNVFSQMEFHQAFYENALSRDGILAEKMINLLKKNNQSSGLLVSGGFHAQGIKEILSEQGINYVVISPKIENIPGVNFYQQHMKGDFSWKDYYREENAKVKLYDAFVRGFRDDLLGYQKQTETYKHFNLAKLWRDQIIRDLASKKKLEKVGRYTLFLDELGKYSEMDWLGKAQSRIDQFEEGLWKLDASRQLNKNRIHQLLQSMKTVDPSAAVLTDARFPFKNGELDFERMVSSEARILPGPTKSPKVKARSETSDEVDHYEDIQKELAGLNFWNESIERKVTFTRISDLKTLAALLLTVKENGGVLVSEHSRVAYLGDLLRLPLVTPTRAKYRGLNQLFLNRSTSQEVKEKVEEGSLWKAIQESNGKFPNKSFSRSEVRSMANTEYSFVQQWKENFWKKTLGRRFKGENQEIKYSFNQVLQAKLDQGVDFETIEKDLSQLLERYISKEKKGYQIPRDRILTELNGLVQRQSDLARQLNWDSHNTEEYLRKLGASAMGDVLDLGKLKRRELIEGFLLSLDPRVVDYQADYLDLFRGEINKISDAHELEAWFALLENCMNSFSSSEGRQGEIVAFSQSFRELFSRARQIFSQGTGDELLAGVISAGIKLYEDSYEKIFHAITSSFEAADKVPAPLSVGSDETKWLLEFFTAFRELKGFSSEQIQAARELGIFDTGNSIAQRAGKLYFALLKTGNARANFFYPSFVKTLAQQKDNEEEFISKNFFDWGRLWDSVPHSSSKKTNKNLAENSRERRLRFRNLLIQTNLRDRWVQSRDLVSSIEWVPKRFQIDAALVYLMDHYNIDVHIFDFESPDSISGFSGEALAPMNVREKATIQLLRNALLEIAQICGLFKRSFFAHHYKLLHLTIVGAGRPFFRAPESEIITSLDHGPATLLHEIGHSLEPKRLIEKSSGYFEEFDARELEIDFLQVPELAPLITKGWLKKINVKKFDKILDVLFRKKQKEWAESWQNLFVDPETYRNNEVLFEKWEKDFITRIQSERSNLRTKLPTVFPGPNNLEPAISEIESLYDRFIAFISISANKDQESLIRELKCLHEAVLDWLNASSLFPARFNIRDFLYMWKIPLYDFESMKEQYGVIDGENGQRSYYSEYFSEGVRLLFTAPNIFEAVDPLFYKILVLFFKSQSDDSPIKDLLGKEIIVHDHYTSYYQPEYYKKIPASRYLSKDPSLTVLTQEKIAKVVSKIQKTKRKKVKIEITFFHASDVELLKHEMIINPKHIVFLEGILFVNGQLYLFEKVTNLKMVSVKPQAKNPYRKNKNRSELRRINNAESNAMRQIAKNIVAQPPADLENLSLSIGNQINLLGGTNRFIKAFRSEARFVLAQELEMQQLRRSAALGWLLEVRNSTRKQNPSGKVAVLFNVPGKEKRLSEALQILNLPLFALLPANMQSIVYQETQRVGNPEHFKPKAYLGRQAITNSKLLLTIQDENGPFPFKGRKDVFELNTINSGNFGVDTDLVSLAAKTILAELVGELVGDQSELTLEQENLLKKQFSDLVPDWLKESNSELLNLIQFSGRRSSLDMNLLSLIADSALQTSLQTSA